MNESIGIFIFIIVIFFFIHKKFSEDLKYRIGREIRRHGAEVVKISEKHFFGHKGAYTYDVVFADQNGQKYKTICIARYWRGDLFWNQTPAELLRLNNQRVDVHIDHGQSDERQTALSSKEQIISDLHAENLRLKEELARINKPKPIEPDDGLGSDI